MALSELLGGSRLSRDIDLFHDTGEAVEASWEADRAQLKSSGHSVRVVRQRPGFVEAEVSMNWDVVRMEWASESVPVSSLAEHPESGLALHPFDLATNELLALVRRREVRDRVDVIECDRRLQPLGYLARASCGKDPGFGPGAIVKQVARTGRFTPGELEELACTGPPPEAAELARRWHAAVRGARTRVELLPPEEEGTCVLVGDDLCRLEPEDLRQSLRGGGLRFRAGCIGGAMPAIRTRPR